MKDVSVLAREILADTYTMSLATVDAAGPWVADVIFVTDEAMNLYWVSSPETRHSQALEKDSRVAASIVVDHADANERSLQIGGNAKRYEGPTEELDLKLEAKWGVPIPKELDQRMISGKVWYIMEPKRIEMLYTRHYEYRRVSVR